MRTLLQALRTCLLVGILADRVHGSDPEADQNKTSHQVLSLSSQYSNPRCAQYVPGYEYVYLINCYENPSGIVWTWEEDGSLRNVIGHCLQAGHGASPKDGTVMRVKPCTNSPLQKFSFEKTEDDDAEGQLKLKDGPGDLCVARANDKQYLIMKKCNVLSDERSYWYLGYNVPEYLFGMGGSVESANSIHIQDKDVYFSAETSGGYPSAHMVMNDCGQIRNGYGECLQVGAGVTAPFDGIHLRMFPCDGNNPMQKFRIRDDEYDIPSEINGQGRFKLQSFDDFCVTASNDPAPDSDWRIMIMKPCPPKSDKGSRWNWLMA